MAAPFVAVAQIAPPEPKDQPQPEIPVHAQMRLPLEGWVTVRYTVRADGSTDDIRLVSTAPAGYAGEKAALDVVKDWTFTPATVNGEPVDWYNNVSAVVFDAPGESAPSDFFVQSYAGIVRLLQDGNVEQARTRLEATRPNTSRLSEIGLIEMQAAAVLAGAGDIEGAYAAIRRATDERVQVLEDNDLANALVFRFDIESELGYFGDALYTYERVEAIHPLAEDDPTAQVAGMVRQALNSGASIEIDGSVDREPWFHEPTRRTFSLTDVDGTIRGIELECNRRKSELAFVEDTEWTIPESWGDCVIGISARRNTTFTLVEFPTIE